MPKPPAKVLFEYNKTYDPDTGEVIMIDLQFAEKMVFTAKTIGRVYGVMQEKGKGVRIHTIPTWYEAHNKRVNTMKGARRELVRYMKWASSELYLLAAEVGLEEADESIESDRTGQIFVE